jgi:hypothetical protein
MSFGLVRGIRLQAYVLWHATDRWRLHQVVRNKPVASIRTNRLMVDFASLESRMAHPAVPVVSIHIETGYAFRIRLLRLFAVVSKQTIGTLGQIIFGFPLDPRSRSLRHWSQIIIMQ